MASEETSSISKGCFLFNANAKTQFDGSKSKVRKKIPVKASKVLLQGNKFPPLVGETSEQTDLRYENFQKCWKRIFQQIKSIQIELNRKVFTDLLEFVKKSYKRNGVYLQRTEIPTAALLTGMNMPDHEIIFNKMTSDLKQNVTPHIVLLHSKDCSNLKLLLREVLIQLMTSNEESKVIEEDLDKSCIEDMGKIKHFTMNVLKSWYTENTRNSNDKPPIVIIFEDFERFNRSVLQDFIQICSIYTDSMPIVMIFALATTIAAVHKSLPHSVSTRLSIEKFQAEPSLECLHEVLNKVFLTSECPFKLGPKMSNLLFDKFLLQDFSIQNFANAVQFSMMEHFYSNPLSILCCEEMTSLNSIVDEFSHGHLSYVRNSRSFRRYCDRKSLDEQQKLKNDDSFLKKTVTVLIKELLCLKLNLFPMLKCLHILSSKLPGCPFGKRLKDVYEFSLKHEIVKTDIYQNSLILIKQTSRDDLLSSLQECCKIMKDSVENKSLDSSFEEILQNLKFLIDRFDKLNELQKNMNDTAQSSSKTITKLPTYKNRFEFQERMRQAVKEKKATPYDNLRSDIVDFWDNIFRQYLQCPMKLPLHEVMFFDKVDTVSPHINPTPLLAIQTALRNPNHYLECKCCKIDADDNQDSLPDVSIVYKIHLECGRMINLYDWLQAFASINDASSSTAKKSSKKRQAEDEQLQARFIQSVSELQLLGFIKPTKRKADHVQRLTWGF